MMSKEKPSLYTAADSPLCAECQELDLSFFDPTCSGCLDILSNPRTTISEIFAIIRQWVPQTQQNIDLLVSEIFNRGGHIEDRDGLTDMTILHYVAKSGAMGVGDIENSKKVLQILIDKGADANAKCRWTDMTALHYAVFFDIKDVVELLLEHCREININQRCKEFDNGTALHIGCTNLSIDCVKSLIAHGANPNYPDQHGRLPIRFIPNVNAIGESKEALAIAESLQNILLEAMSKTKSNKAHNLSISTLQALGLDMYDQVIVAGKVGILKFCGATEFASGQWAGIELNDPVGKNDGSINGIRYFECKPKYGIFAPLTRVNKYEGHSPIPISIPPRNRSPKPVSTHTKDINLGDKVVVAGRKIGTLRYVGPTKFASGSWAGVELHDPAGKNDGTVAGVRYFKCDSKHGVFAPISKVKRVVDDDSQEPMNNSTKNYAADGIKYDYQAPPKPINDTPPKPINETLPKSINKTPPKSINETPLKPKSSDEKSFGSRVNFVLREGMCVYANNDVGTVRYIGRVDFADDTWLGIELRKPNGKNDGTVEGRKYFMCKPLHGLMVRPNRVTCRGINCSQLVDRKMR